MSGNQRTDPRKTLITIKIAPKDASQRQSGGTAGGASGSADPGPGDPLAAPSVAPQVVDIPPPPTASELVVKSAGQTLHDEDEEGEGEVELPEGGAGSAGVTGHHGGSGHTKTEPSELPPTAGSSKAATSGGLSKAASSTRDASGPAASSGQGGVSGGAAGKKKVTKFRYHKRITVRTHGKTSPSQIMDKVNKKDHQAGISPSNIEEMDPQELMQRAGIKAGKAHWRVRVRQTKRLTKDGKTTTQTKVAYRDSEGNKRIKTSSTPNCKNCGKKLEDCKCEASSQN